MMLIFLATGGIAKAQTLTVADGTVTNNYVPFNAYWGDMGNGPLSETIYPDSLLTGLTGKSITGLTWYTNCEDMTFSQNLTVQIGTTEMYGYLQYSDIIEDGLTAVYDGECTVSDGQIAVVFDEPYVYEGGRLVVYTHLGYGNCSSSTRAFYGIESPAYSSVYYYGSSNTGYVDFMPKVTFTYTEGGDTPEQADDEYFYISASGWAIWKAAPSVYPGDTPTPDDPDNPDDPDDPDECVIESIDITGFTAPTFGATATTANLQASSNDYEITYAGWFNYTDDDPLAEGDTFGEDTYYLYVVLSPTGDCQPGSNVIFTINGQDGIADTPYCGYNEEYGVFYISSIDYELSEPVITDIIDFETGDFSQAVFTMDETYPWVITDTENNTEDGTYCMKSSNAEVNSSTSEISLNVSVSEIKAISFMAKISSEQNWDKGYFSIDGEDQINGISGNGEWSEYSFKIEPGVHTLRWYYTKDYSGNSNDDCFYVDDIAVTDYVEPPFFPITFEFGIPEEAIIINNDGDSKQFELYTTGAHNGTQCISVGYNANGNDDWFIVPATPTENQSVSLYAKSGNSSYFESFNILVSTTDTELESFTNIGSFTDVPNDYTQYTADLSEYAGQDIYVAIQCVSVDKFRFYVDDIDIIDNVAKKGFRNMSGKALAANSTKANRSTITWNFDDGTLGDWTTIDADGDGNDWGAYNASQEFSAHSGDYVAASWSWYSYNAYDPDNYLISPELNLTDGGILLYYVATNESYPDHYGVFASTTGNTADDFTIELLDETAGTAKLANLAKKDNAKAHRLSMTGNNGTRDMTEWAVKTITLPAGTKYVAFRHYNSSDMNYLFIDDVTISDGTIDMLAGYNLYLDNELVANLGLDVNDYYMQAAESFEDGTQHTAKLEAVYESGATIEYNKAWGYQSGDHFTGSPDGLTADIADGTANLTWTMPSAGMMQTDFTYDFADGTFGSLTVLDANNDGSTWAANEGIAYIWYSEDGNNDYLILPQMTLSEESVFSFITASYSSNYPESFNVVMSTTGTEAADFSTTIASGTTSSTSGELLTYDLSEYAGQTVYLAIQNVSVDQYAQLLTGISVTNVTMEAHHIGAIVYRDGEVIATLRNGEESYTDTEVEGNPEYCIRIIQNGSMEELSYYALAEMQCIEKPADTLLTISPAGALIEIGGTQQFTATLNPANEDYTITWAVADATIASVDADGLVTGIAEGETTVTAYCGPYSAEATITVVEEIIYTLTIDPFETTIEVGATQLFTAILDPADANASFVWATDDETVATVDENGLVTGVAPGETKVTVTYGELSAEATVTVTEPLSSLCYDFEDGTLGDWTIIHNGDGNYTFEISGTANTGSYGVTSHWQDNPDEFLVSKILKASANSSISFWAKNNGNYYIEHFGVFVSTTSNTDPTSFEMVSEWDGTSTWTEYTANLSNYDGQDIYVAIRHFDSPDKFYLFVDDICLIDMTDGVEPTSLSISPKDVTIYVGTTQQFTATVAPEGTTLDLVWSSSDEAIATIDDNGLATGLTDGTTTITVASADGEYTASTTLTVVTPVCQAPYDLAANTDENGNVTLTWAYNAVDGYFFDFEEDLEGWTTFQGEGAESNWLHTDNHPSSYDYSEVAHSGTGFAMSYSYVDYVGVYQANNYLVSPKKYTMGNGAAMTFFYDYANESYPDFFEVMVSTGSNDNAADFTSVWTSATKSGNNSHGMVRKANGTRYNNWQEVTVDLSAYAGQEIWIAFHHEDYDNYEIWIDDVEITGVEMEASTGLFYVYRSTDGETYELIAENVEETTFTDELLPDGTYYYQVRAFNTLAEDYTCLSEPALATNGIDDFVMVTTDGVKENDANISIYPNPTKGNVNIEAEGISSIVVMNALGQVVYEANVGNDNAVINMSNFGAGMYMFSITTNNGVIVKRVNVVK